MVMGPAPDYAAGALTKKRLHPVLWIAICLAGFMLVVTIAVLGAGLYLADRFSQDPVGVATALLSAVDSDLEVVSGSLTNVTIRDKGTGRVFNLRFDELKNAAVHVRNGRHVLSLESRGRTITIGSPELPEWLNGCTDERITRALTIRDLNSVAGSQTFETEGGAAKILDSCTDALNKAGLQATRSDNGLAARTDDGRRELSLRIVTEDAPSRVILSYTARD